MNNKQIEIILDSINSKETLDYVLDTFYHPMEKLKTTVARGLKGMKTPLVDEDLKKIKSTFLQYEMVVDKSLLLEKDVIEKIVAKQDVPSEKVDQIKELHDKECSLVYTIDTILNKTEAKCQIYDLLHQTMYKSQDRVDVINHFLKKSQG